MLLCTFTHPDTAVREFSVLQDEGLQTWLQSSRGIIHQAKSALNRDAGRIGPCAIIIYSQVPGQRRGESLFSRNVASSSRTLYTFSNLSRAVSELHPTEQHDRSFHRAHKKRRWVDGASCGLLTPYAEVHIDGNVRPLRARCRSVYHLQDTHQGIPEQPYRRALRALERLDQVCA